MVAPDWLRGCLPFYLPVILCLLSLNVNADSISKSEIHSELTVEHHDPIIVDPTLNLSKLITQTLEKYPDTLWIKALEEESMALKGRSESTFAGSANASLAFQEATSGTLHYVDAVVQVPLWNIGQRQAQETLAKYAASSAANQNDAVKLKVAGLVRTALWEIALADLSYQQAQAELDMTEQLFAKVKRRVELGDLPRADSLLAQTEVLQKRSVVTLAQAELMHARKRFISITQDVKVPANYQESLCSLKTIQQNHAALTAIDTLIERKQAELSTVKLVGSGQTHVAIGINSDRGNHDPRSNKTESFNIAVSMPFGGSAHLEPQIAAVNVELNRLLADREQLVRILEQAHHEAEHNLEVNRVETQIAEQLKSVAEEHLKMTQLSFSVGEIDLIDLLKIQTRTQQAILNAKQRAVMLQRDIALYNQAVGVMP